MKLLAIETSTEACSAALWWRGEVRERYVLAPRGHAGLILTLAEQLLQEAAWAVGDLDGLAFGRGPGAFTGLRIAAGVIQGIALAADLPVAPVSTLAALAQGTCRECGRTRILTALDARMGEVYWGGFEQESEDALVAPRLEETVCAPEHAPLPPGEGWYGAGSGYAAYGAILSRRAGPLLGGYEPERYPHARDVALLGAAALKAGKGVGAEDALPIYFRDRVTG